ncbi:hypothetical protein [Actinacidiphila paucisporea]|uniref:X-Pro dipeptidyl-peptidase n=1 Tax=Actinacidiphila paucisporea TaxID=310782 RepID=A0A1M7P086_9ACTN|nr:X-Pro dipeptidyl-peptidase [Actinacidiphila paucisporea]
MVPAGHRLALIVAGTDSGLIVAPSTKPTISLDLSRSSMNLPLVGGFPAPAPAHAPRPGAGSRGATGGPSAAVPAGGPAAALPASQAARLR